jgi:hypothetical protein
MGESSDELVQAVRMARMVGMPYRLDWSMATGVQTLTLANRKKTSFLFGRELPAKEVLRT